MINNEMGEFLKESRLERGFKQNELARRLGLDPQVISNVENGRALLPKKKFSEVAKLLRIDFYELLDIHLEDTRRKICRLNKRRYI